MEIFCKKCRMKVGKISDDKIPTGKKMTVNCPKCREKIHFIKPVDFSIDPSGADESETQPQAPQFSDQPSNQPPAGQANKIADYDFSIMAIIREAWAKTSGSKGPLWGASGLVFLAIAVFTGIVSAVANVLGSGATTAALGAALQLTISVASYPIMAGFMLVGIRRSIDLPINYKMVFSCFGYILPLVISSFLTTLLTFFGFLLLVIPGIYLSVAYLMVIPLIIDKEMGPWQAMETSRKAINRHWFKVFGLYLLMGLIFTLSSIPMGIGIIWTFPMFILVGGILYREIFGVNQES